MDKRTYATIPPTLVLRELALRVGQRGDDDELLDAETADPDADDAGPHPGVIHRCHRAGQPHGPRMSWATGPPTRSSTNSCWHRGSRRSPHRELLDPAYFVKVTNSRGGVAPDEVARMIVDRRQKLADARARHLKRIESLENAQKKMLSDLHGLYEKSEGT